MARLGSGDIELTVRGRSFDAFSTVLFDGVRLATRWIDRGTLRAVIPSDLLASAGTFRVSVTDPRFLGKGSSNYYGFVVSY